MPEDLVGGSWNGIVDDALVIYTRASNNFTRSVSCIHGMVPHAGTKVLDVARLVQQTTVNAHETILSVRCD